MGGAGVDFKIKKLNIDGKSVKLAIWVSSFMSFAYLGHSLLRTAICRIRLDKSGFVRLLLHITEGRREWC